MSARPDAWLAAIIGRPAFVVDGADAPDEPGFYTAKVPVADVVRVAALERRGFSVVDVNVTLARTASEAPGDPTVAVEAAGPDDTDALVAIAESCFRWSRFHLDPAVPNELADRVKGEWVRSAAAGHRGIELLAARERGRAVGFLVVVETPESRVIDLVGVDADAQRTGVGFALVEEFVRRHGPSHKRLLVGTQIANTPSLRLYARAGFALESATYVLHRHIGAA